MTGSLRVTVPSDDSTVELILTSSGTISGTPPAGIAVVYTNVTDNVISLDYVMSLSIQDASLLSGGQISCDQGTPIGQVMERCPLAGEYE